MALFDEIRMGAAGAGGDYEVERSLRFNSGDSPELTRTPVVLAQEQHGLFLFGQRLLVMT